MRDNLLKSLALGLLLTTSARSATNIIDFNTNPTNSGIYRLFGNVVDTNGVQVPWRPGGGKTGAANDGYLAITDSAGGLNSILVFKDIENGLILKAFTFECDLRLGGGTEPPADGFSINVARANDPVVAQSDAGTAPNTFAGTGTDGVGGGGGEANLPEEGTQTGLAIGFDVWQSGLLFGAQDVAGISIKVDNNLIAQLPIPLTPGNIYTPSMPLPGAQGTQYVYDNSATYHNVATNSTNYVFSMQTGARNTTDDLNGDGVVTAADVNTAQPAYGSPNFDLWLKNLTWEHFIAQVTEDLKVVITWKGVEVTPPGGLDVSTFFQPTAARIVLAGRTGGSWEANHIDNIKLVTIPFTGAAITAFSGNASGFQIQISDQGGANLLPASLVLTLNGGAITPILNKVGNTTFVVYNASPFLAIGSTNTVNITYSDTGGNNTATLRKFIVKNYVTIPADYAVTGVDTSKPGFSALMHQIPIVRTPGDANTIANAERQIANAFLSPATGLAYANMIPDLLSGASPPDNTDGTYHVNTVNWNVNPVSAFDTSADPSAADIGNFRHDNPFPLDVEDLAVPGVNAGAEIADSTVSGYNDNIVAEVKAYLDIPAGYYTFGVNSDDGFKVSAGRGIGEVVGLTLGSFNGGRGSGDSLFDVYVPTAGVFPVRLLWWQGGGGGNCEFFYLDPGTGQKILINDSAAAHVGGLAYTTTAPIKAYDASVTTAARPHVSRISPEAGQNFVFVDADVSAWITDGTITVNAAAVSLTVNGTTVVGGTKTGGVTKITRPGSLANLLLSGGNTASLIYSFVDGANTINVTNTWSFTVVPYHLIPAANAVPAGSVTLTDIGFKALVDQIDRSGDSNQGNGARLPNVGDQNRQPRIEMELYGGDIDPTNGLRYPNLAQAGPSANWNYDVAGPINFNSNPANGATGVALGDGSFPGLPGAGSSISTVQGIESYVAEFRTYLDLKAGTYVFGLNSDDGFVATAGPDPHDTLGTLVGFANVGRGNSAPLPAPSASAVNVNPTPGTSSGNTVFQVIVPADGLYPFRILYWQGGGGVNAEFVSIDKGSGLQPLIAGGAVATATNAASIPGYRTYTGSPRPWTRFSVSPTPWDNRIMQGGPGPILAYGRTDANLSGGDIVTDSDTRRPWANVGIGGVIANGTAGPVGLVLNGVTVPATLTTNGNDVTVVYRPSPPLPSGSTNTAGLVYGGTTNWWTFIVQSYTNLNSSDALPIASADLTAPGFQVKMFQSPSGQPNTVARAESQISGGITPNISVPGPGPNGTYLYPGIINWNNNLNSTNLGGLPLNPNGTPIGNFQTNAGWTGWPYATYPDEIVPGVPGTNVTVADNIAAEVFSYLKFDTAGYYRFGVNSDDGFAMKIGTPGQTNGEVVFSVDVGKGSSDIPFSFTVPQAGLYPVRLVYYNGGGGANLEYFSYDDNGKKIPINDPNDAGAIKAYYKVAAGLQFTSATLTGGNLTLNWNGTGTFTVQQATVLTGSPGDWSNVTNITGNTYSTPVGAGNRFFRLSQ